MSPPPAPPLLAALDATPMLFERTHRALLDAIVSGELAPGERHTQDALAQRLGVSRQPVLQALVLLRHQGLVRDAPGRRGIEVVPISSALVQHLYLVRGALDALTARSAAHRPRPELRERGAALIRAGRAAAGRGDTRAMADADAAFHALLGEAAHNPLLSAGTADLWHQTRRAIVACLRRPTPQRDVWDEHLAILNAVVRGDTRTAERLARAHCEASCGRLLRQLFGDDGPAVAGPAQRKRR
jgi:DNA-binding GntR family transcriptional regulator